MITQLTGKLVEIYPTYAVIDCHGVGYWVNISLQTYEKTDKKENITLYTQQIIREDQHILFGFSGKFEREVFQKLISVNGVGPASAMMMLSTISADEIIVAINDGNAPLLQSVKGIGLKTAQRIIIDLKNKLELNASFDINSSTLKNKTKFEALTALEVLGFPKKNIEKILDSLVVSYPNAEVEFLVKETLKKL